MKFQTDIQLSGKTATGIEIPARLEFPHVGPRP